MSILKNYKYTQLKKGKYQEAVNSLNNDEDLSLEDFYAISYNLNKMDNPSEILDKLFKSKVETNHKKKLSNLISLEEVNSLLTNRKSFIQLFMYPKIVPISIILLVVSFLLKPLGIGIIILYLLGSVHLSKALRKKLVKQYS